MGRRNIEWAIFFSARKKIKYEPSKLMYPIFYLKKVFELPQVLKQRRQRLGLAWIGDKDSCNRIH